MKTLPFLHLFALLAFFANSPLASAAPSTFTLEPDDHILGNPTAAISIVVYTDFECPFCQRHHPTMQELIELYPEKINIVYRNYPLEFHQNALPAAIAAECTAELAGNDTYFSFINNIFASDIDTDSLKQAALSLGIAESDYTACLTSKAVEQRITNDITSGNSYEVSGTPASFVVQNRTGAYQKISGAMPTETFTQVIDNLLPTKPIVRTLPNKKQVTTTRPTFEERLCTRMERFSNNPTTFERVNNRIEKRFGFRCS